MQIAAATWTEAENVPTEPILGLQPRYWHAGWIPFAADGAGNCWCVDAAPASDGQLGQVFLFDHEAGPGAVEAGDLGEWLANYVEMLESGALRVWNSGAISDEPDPGD